MNILVNVPKDVVVETCVWNIFSLCASASILLSHTDDPAALKHFELNKTLLQGWFSCADTAGCFQCFGDITGFERHLSRLFIRHSSHFDLTTLFSIVNILGIIIFLESCSTMSNVYNKLSVLQIRVHKLHYLWNEATVSCFFFPSSIGRLILNKLSAISYQQYYAFFLHEATK